MGGVAVWQETSVWERVVRKAKLVWVVEKEEKGRE